MGYKFTTGSIRRGDIFYEDDETGQPTFIDFDQDSIKLAPSGSAVLEVVGPDSGIGGQTRLLGTPATPPSAGDAQLVIHYDSGDYAWFGVDENGSLTIETVDSDGALGDLWLNPDGNIIMNHNNVQNLSNDVGCGDVIFFGTEDTSDTLAAGKLMYLDTDGKWRYADADAENKSGPVMLAIAMGTEVSHGLLIRGFFDCATIQGTYASGSACYVSETAGVVDFTAPSGAGDVVRVVGHACATPNVIYFNPSPDWILL
tara:strand:- start:6168 stop:6938 length:771 start_codon:yes stop_codon:yes gene_type:complete